MNTSFPSMASAREKIRKQAIAVSSTVSCYEFEAVLCEDNATVMFYCHTEGPVLTASVDLSCPISSLDFHADVWEEEFSRGFLALEGSEVLH